MNKVCLVFNPLEWIMVRGISKYTAEIRDMLLADGATVYTLTMPSIFRHAPRTIQVLLFIIFQQLVLPLYALLKRPDVIFDAYNSYSLLAALRWRYVYVIHDFIPFSNKHWWIKPGSVYQRLLHKISPYLPRLELYYINEIVANEGCQLVKKYYSVIPNVVRPLRHCKKDDISALAVMEELRLKYPDRLIISTISGSGNNKDFNGLIKLLNSTDRRIVIIVFGFDGFESSLSSDSVYCIYPGVVSSDYIGTAISYSDLFVFHSLQEGFGRPVIEALMESSKVLAISHIPAVSLVTDQLRPLLHIYDGPGDFCDNFIVALNAEKPVIEVSELSKVEEVRIVNTILNG
jgi:hypothetical protein